MKEYPCMRALIMDIEIPHMKLCHAFFGRRQRGRRPVSLSGASHCVCAGKPNKSARHAEKDKPKHGFPVRY